MKRQALEDGGWFDLDTATKHDEETFWNGNNHISLATGSQWEHEELYRTQKGRWVLHHWSQMQGSSESWQQVGDEMAAEWLIANNEPIPDDLLNTVESLEI